jgi:hypothetical protein
MEMTLTVGDKIICEAHPVTCTIFGFRTPRRGEPHIYIEYYFENNKIFDWIYRSEILKKI